MEQLPRITVITVVRNAARTLPRAIESLIAQAYPNLEYLVLDAASTDGTLEIIQQHSTLINHWRSHRDDGPNAAANEGIARATGEIIAFLNADDWYEPGILQTIGETFAADPTLDMVTCQARVMERSGDELVEVRRFEGRAQQASPLGSPIPNARFCRKSVFDRYGGFQVKNFAGQLFISSDLEFLLRLSQHSIKNRELPVLGYSYLRHKDSITFGDNPKHERQMYEERAVVAGQYLNVAALRPYRRRLKRWHRRGTARVFYWSLAEKNFKKAWRVAMVGMRISNVAWVADAARLGITGGYKLA